jgi:hypothetical protein
MTMRGTRAKALRALAKAYAPDDERKYDERVAKQYRYQDLSKSEKQAVHLHAALNNKTVDPESNEVYKTTVQIRLELNTQRAVYHAFKGAYLRRARAA